MFTLFNRRLDYKTVQEQNVHPLEQKAKTPTGNRVTKTLKEARLQNYHTN